MKGLLRNNFYSMGANLQLAFGISFVLVFIPVSYTHLTLPTTPYV